MRKTWIIAVAVLALARPLHADSDGTPLPGTKPLEARGDLAARMVDDVKDFLLKKMRETDVQRAHFWPQDVTSDETRAQRAASHRAALAQMLGVRDALVHDERDGVLHSPRFEPFSSPFRSVHTTARYDRNMPEIQVKTVRWPAFADVFGEGLLIEPSTDPKATIVLIGDADQTPEQLCGVGEATMAGHGIAARLARSGCRVLVVAITNRAVEPRNGRAKLTTREYLHRSAFEMGRTLRGYEIELVLTGAVAVSAQEYDTPPRRLPQAIIGYGEGGLIALEAAALEPRFSAVLVSGAFEKRENTWKQPLDRNVFGLLQRFGNAELAALIAPRPLVIEASAFPNVSIPSGTGGAPGALITPPFDEVKAEVEKAQTLTTQTTGTAKIQLIKSGEAGDGPPFSEPALKALLAHLLPGTSLASADHKVAWSLSVDQIHEHAAQRAARQLHAFDRHTQQLLDASPAVRTKFMQRLDTSTLETYARTIEPYRTQFYEQAIGKFNDQALSANPRSRQIFETDKLTGYEVMLDLWQGVFAYGILVVPKEIPDGERRPVVVCQHGLEGRPNDLADPKVDNLAYNQYALRLAERGFVTFAPQNLYIGEDRFRTLQRLANPLGKSLFSIIIPQHQQITDWLKTLPFVDDSRIAFYGLSYGGKSAMRIPPLVSNYCLSICSADFNEWVWKNASTRSPYSYVWTGEYEIFEWDLGSTFNYAEMAALIAPRPFMVERGHFDGVAPDETVAYEFAKVRFLYEAKLKLPSDHCQLEWFVGPHTIHGVGTFEFLHRHLNWPSTQPIVPLNKP